MLRRIAAILEARLRAHLGGEVFPFAALLAQGSLVGALAFLVRDGLGPWSYALFVLAAAAGLVLLTLLGEFGSLLRADPAAAWSEALPASGLEQRLGRTLAVLSLLALLGSGVLLPAALLAPEAMTVADRLLLLHDGRIEQKGAPQEVHAHPVSPSAARFFGLGNLLRGEVAQSGGPQLIVNTTVGSLRAAHGAGAPFSPGQAATLLLRHGAARRVVNGAAAGPNRVHGRVVDAIFRGQDCRVVLQMEEGLQMQFDLDQPPAIGESVTLSIDPDGILCFPRQTGENPTG